MEVYLFNQNIKRLIGFQRNHKKIFLQGHHNLQKHFSLKKVFLTLIIRNVYLYINGGMKMSQKFQQITERCKLVKKSDTHLFYEFEVSEEDLNFVFSLHGGCTSTILEFCMKNAVSSLDISKKAVTVDLCISYLNAATMGDILLIEVEKIKEGGSMAFIAGKISRKSDKIPVAIGKQTLSILSDSFYKIENFEDCKVFINSDSIFLKAFIEFYNSFSLDGVNYIFDRCKAIHAKLGHIIFEFTPTKEDMDEESNLHNGCLATLLDVLMSLSIFGGNNSGQLGVTADLNITYLEKLDINEKLMIESKVIKKGTRMAFIQAKAWKIKDGKNVIVAVANQSLTVFKGFASSSKM